MAILLENIGQDLNSTIGKILISIVIFTLCAIVINYYNFMFSIYLKGRLSYEWEFINLEICFLYISGFGHH